MKNPWLVLLEAFDPMPDRSGLCGTERRWWSNLENF